MVTKYEKDTRLDPDPPVSIGTLPNLYNELSKLDFQSEEAQPIFSGVSAIAYFANWIKNTPSPNEFPSKYRHTF